jgi:osmotically-inducible protein OsmY
MRDDSSYAGLGPRGYKRSQEKIKDEVCGALWRDPDVDATEIAVTVQDNRVTLRGFVDSRHSRRHAEVVAESIFGVEEVLNLLRIKRTLDLKSDKLITRGDEGFFSQETIER